MRSLANIIEQLLQLAGGPFTDDEVRNIIAALERDNRQRPGGAAQSAGPPWPRFVQDTLDDLSERVVAINLTVDLLTIEEAVAERDLLDSIRAFAAGVDAARKQLLDNATKDARG